MSAIELNDKRQIVIELSWLLSALNDDQKRELVDSLACENAIIEDVSAQLLSGWTERGSHGSRSCTADAEPYSPLDKARRELASRCDEVAKKEIEDLKRSLVWEKAVGDRYRDMYFALYHAWPSEWRGRMPSIEPLTHTITTGYKVVKEESS